METSAVSFLVCVMGLNFLVEAEVAAANYFLTLVWSEGLRSKGKTVKSGCTGTWDGELYSLGSSPLDKWKKNSSSSLSLAMIFNGCDAGKGYNKLQGCCIPEWVLWTTASIGILMLVTIVTLSICLCRVCKRTKKRISKQEDDNPEEANLHYAELQNLPASSRGQCDGGTCPSSPPAVQNSDYATVAELQGTVGAGRCSPEQTEEDEGVDDGVKENQPCVELE